MHIRGLGRQSKCLSKRGHAARSQEGLLVLGTAFPWGSTSHPLGDKAVALGGDGKVAALPSAPASPPRSRLGQGHRPRPNASTESQRDRVRPQKSSPPSASAAVVSAVLQMIKAHIAPTASARATCGLPGSAELRRQQHHERSLGLRRRVQKAAEKGDPLGDAAGVARSADARRVPAQARAVVFDETNPSGAGRRTGPAAPLRRGSKSVS